MRIGLRWSGNQSRVVSFACSVSIHAILLTALANLPSRVAQRAPLDGLGAASRPLERSVIWYPPRGRLPEIAPQRRRWAPPQGKRGKARLAASNLPTAKPADQLLWRLTSQPAEPAPRLPNLFVFQAPAASRPPERPKREQFAPPQKPKATQVPTLPAGPAIQATASETSLLVWRFGPPAPLTNRPKPEPFAMPAGRPRPEQTSAALDSPPSLAGAPPGELAAAVVGVRPAERLEAPIPEGAPPAQISTTSRSTSAPASKASIDVPGLLIQGGQQAAESGVARTVRAAIEPRSAPAPAAGRTELALERWQAEARSVLSAPLRPGARVIPGAIDARFRGRSVYTTSFLVTAEAGEPADWVVWFAEREQPMGQNPAVRPPVPWRKLGRNPAPHPNGLPAGRVQLSAIIRQDGRVDSIVPLPGPDQGLNQIAIQALERWQFLPAVRNGEPVEVEAVVEISVARSTGSGR